MPKEKIVRHMGYRQLGPDEELLETEGFRYVAVRKNLHTKVKKFCKDNGYTIINVVEVALARYLRQEYDYRNKLRKNGRGTGK